MSDSRITGSGPVVRPGATFFRAYEGADYGYGLPSQIVLKDIMGLSVDEPQEVTEKIAGIYDSLEAGDIQGAKGCQHRHGEYGSGTSGIGQNTQDN